MLLGHREGVVLKSAVRCGLEMAFQVQRRGMSSPDESFVGTQTYRINQAAHLGDRSQ